MELEEAKLKFVQAWGTFGSNWGINRTMAQVHALLWVSPESLCADDIMKELKISRGNANMNIRALIDWGLVYKELKQGERREYFIAEKDIWKIVRQIIIHRKKKELEPVLNLLDELKDVKGGDEADSKQFVETIDEIQAFAGRVDKVLDKFIKSDSNWLMTALLKML